MAFTQSLKKLFPTFGVPLANDASYVQSALSLSGATIQTWPTPATGSLSPTTSCGRVRVKIYTGGGTSPTVVAVILTGSDGTTTVELGSFNPAVARALSANQVVDIFFDYLTDLNLTSLTISTTLGGTSPTASMDMEVCPIV